MKDKKIILLSSSDTRGGAAIAAFRLFNALKRNNDKAKLIVKKKFSDNEDVVISANLNKEYSDYEKIIDTTRRSFKKAGNQNLGIILTAPLYPGYNICDHTDFRSADIVNIHSVRQFLSVDSIGKILETSKKIVFTLHDESFYTGGCVYTDGCEQYTNTCNICHQLGNFKINTPNWLLEEKLKIWGKHRINVITPSKWISGQASRSRLLKDANIWNIANGIDTDLFKKYDKNYAKQAFNIPQDKIIILTGAMSLKIKRKGYDLLLRSLELLEKNNLIKKKGLKNIIFATFGNTAPDHDNFNFPVFSFGEIDSEEKLALIYSAADMFILPSLEDNLPNTILESMSCGTPVVAFDTGGAGDVIEHDKNGLIVEQGNINLLSKSIADLILDDQKRKILGDRSRIKIEDNFTLEIQAEKYIEIFKNLE